MVDVPPRLSLLLVTLALSSLAVPARASVPEVTAVLTLAQEPADRARLHALAGRSGRHSLASLAPAARHRSAALDWARRSGLRVVRGDAWTVTVVGPRAEVVRARTVLAGHVTSVVGLDSRRVHRTHATRSGVDNPQTGTSLRAAYDVPTEGRGAGVTVGILNLAGWQRSDLTTFAAHEGIPLAPGQVTEVPVGLDPTELDGFGSEFEVALDSEAVLAVAPEARQRLYFAPNTEAGIVDALSEMAGDAAAGLIQVASTSWGICEPRFKEGSADLRLAYAEAIDRLVAAGSTLFAASGDSGAFDCSTVDQPSNQAQVDFPASYVNTVAVGGTTLNPGGPETAWYDRGFGSYVGSGTGGGESLDQPLPAHQAGLVPGATHRLVPDVASDADPQSGLGIYVESAGGWTVAGGTSLGAPTWAAMLASALSVPGRTTGLGNVLPALYAGTGMADVTEGHNGLWSAGPGFDRTTGLGVPRWSVLGPALIAATPAPPSDRTPTPPTPRPAPAADPGFTVWPSWVRTTTVPISVTASPSYTGFAAGETVAGCAQQQPTAPTTALLDPDPYQGEHLVTLTALDDSQTCHVREASVFYDSVPPAATVGAAMLTTADARVRITLGGSDAGSGIGRWQVVVRLVAGQVVSRTDTVNRQLVTTLRAGESYVIEATARDRAGNIGRTAGTRITLPLDDSVFVRSGAWGRQSRIANYQGSHLRAAAAGASARHAFQGRDATLWLQRGSSGGYAYVYVDGRRTHRLDLYATTTSLLRVRVGTWSVPGRHTVQVTVVGTHRAGSRGSDVFLDALAITP